LTVFWYRLQHQQRAATAQEQEQEPEQQQELERGVLLLGLAWVPQQ